MNIKITTDSTCDLSPQQLQQHNISLIPLYVNLGGKCLRDIYDVTPDDIYAHVASGGDISSTAAVNISDYAEFFAPLSASYDAVIHLNLSAELSSSHQNARLAAEDFDNVYVVDSQCLTTGQGLMALHCAQLAESGMDAQAILADLADFQQKVDVSFILSQLDYLAKGGRCSSVVALGANLLSLKPCIEMENGLLHVGKKYRGSFQKCMERYIRDRLAHPEELDLSHILITHSGLDEATLELARQTVADCAAFAEVSINRAGCTISSHCGPGTMGIVFAHK